MSQTTHFNLDKRELTDNIGNTAITTYNSNMDTIDSGLNMISNKNYIINGNFDIWQRGTSFSIPLSPTTTSQYTCDRFTYVSQDIASTISRVAITDLLKSNYAINIDVTSLGTSPFHIVRQLIEPDIFSLFEGQTITLSCYSRLISGSGNIALDIGDISPSIFALTNQWTKYEVTSTIPFSHSITFVDVAFSGSISEYQLAQVKLEIGDRATPFIPKTEAEELRDCQRYYEKSYGISISPGTLSTTNGLQLSLVPSNTVANLQRYSPVEFKVSKRTTPTMIIYGLLGTISSVSNPFPVSDFGANTGALPVAGEKSFYIRNNSGGSFITDGNSIVYHWVADAEL